MKKRLLATFLSLVMVLGLLPTVALAMDKGDGSGIGEENAWDVSANNDGSVYAYLVANEDSEPTTTYTLHIEGTGAMADYGTQGTPWYSQRASITSIILPDGLTRIGNSAFLQTAITEIEIPNTVTSIGQNAFWNCNSIKTTVPASVTELGETAFFGSFDVTFVSDNPSYMTDNVGVIYSKDGTKLIQAPQKNIEDYRIFDTVTEIGAYAFSGCDNLTGDLVIPDSVISIGRGAFNGAGISSLTLGNSVTEIGDSAFAGCTSLAGELVIPDSVVTIGNSAFSRSSATEVNKVTSITLGSGVKSVGGSAFLGCTSATSLTLNEGLETIGNYAFADCSSLTGDLNIPSTVTSIGTQAFRSCKFNGTLTLGGELSTWDTGIFSGVTQVTKLVLRDGVTEIPESAFANWTTLTDVTIPDTVTAIGNRAFANCSSLKTVGFGKSVETIGDSAFTETAIEDLELPNSLKTIGTSAFARCVHLKAVNIPESVTSIGYAAFSYNSKVETVTVPLGEITYGASGGNHYIFTMYNGEGESAGETTAALTTVVLGNTPENVTVYTLFANSLESLQTIVLGTGVYSIGNSAISNVNSFESGLYPSTMQIGSNNNTFTEKATKYTMATETQVAPDGTLQMMTFEDSSDTIINNITYSSSNNDVLSVNESGLITAKGLPTETATIYASYNGIVFAKLELTIAKPSNLTDVSENITVVKPNSLVYDGSAKTYSATCEEIENFDVVYYDDENGVRLESAPVSAGQYRVIIYGENETQYALHADTFTITPAALIITADNKSVYVGDAMPEFTYSMSGLVVGDTESVITTAPAFACDASDTNTAGDYTITPSNADAGDNYTITYKSGTLTIQNRSSSTGTTRYTVTIEDMDNGEVTSSPSRASRGQTVTITATPDAGYELANLTVTDASGNMVTLNRISDTRYTFTMPRGNVTVKAAFAEIAEEPILFTDVPESAYYYDAVYWAVENGVTNGTGATTFSPNITCTCAQMVTFLWRAAGSPEPETSAHPFTDLEEDAYYYDAVLWAVENGITNGTSATTFSPEATVTRAQTVAFLWRYDGEPAAGGGSSFTDVASDTYYADAVAWAVKEHITNGTSATTFSPDADCIRAQIVTFLYRFMGE